MKLVNVLFAVDHWAVAFGYGIS